MHVLFLNANGTVKTSTKIASGTNGGPALANDDFFGRSVTSLGDLDGDGVTDLAVGAVFDDTNGIERGAVHVLFLNASGTVKSSTKIASGTNGGPILLDRDFFGSSVASLGDLDGDGVTDLAVGAAGDDTNGNARGGVHVLFLKQLNANSPVFTSNETANIPENTTTVLTVTATDADRPAQNITFSLTGGADQLRFAITAGGVLTFLAAPDFESPTDADGDNVYLVQVTADDGVGGTTIQDLTITVTPVNDHNPVITSNAAANVPENTTAVLTVTATDADLPLQNVTFSLTGGADLLKFAITAGGVLTFLAPPNFESPTDANGDNVYLVQVTADDGVGGTTAQDLSVTVTPVSESNPVFTSNAAANVPENSIAVLTVTATDADLPALNVTFSLTGGADQLKFAITAGGVLTFLTPPNFESPTDANGDNVYLVQVTANDGAGGTTVQDLTVTVTPVNDHNPVITSSATANVPENTTAVLIVTATDADLPTQDVTFSVTGGADQLKFTITPLGILTFVTAPSFDNPTDANGDNVYRVEVTANDGAGRTVVQSLSVGVFKNNNHSPVFTSNATANVPENTTDVLTVTATDADLPAQNVTFLLTGGADQLKFAITAGGVLTFVTAPNFESPTDANGDNVYLVQVTASDGAGRTTAQNLSVTVTAVNDNSPVLTSNATANVPENTTAVLTVTATDADLPTQNVTFSLTGGADQLKFAITAGGVLTFVTTPNFENPTDANGDNVYLVQVTANDGAGRTTLQDLTVTVTPVNDNNPVITASATANVPENSIAVLTVTATDADLPTQNVTFSLTGGADQLKFAITAGGVLTFVTAPNFESPTDANGDNVYLVQVTANDGAGRTTLQDLSVTVTPVNETPSISSILPQTIQEDTPTSSLAFTSSDPESLPDTLILTPTSSNPGLIPNSHIVISGTGTQRSVVVTPAANQSGSAMITITVSDGTNSAQQTFQVTVQAVDDPAVIGLNPLLLVRIPAKKSAPIDTSATISDIDTPTLTFDWAILRVSGHTVKDSLSILKLNGVARKGTNVVVGTTVIGTLTGGKKGSTLNVLLNGSATPSAVQSLLRSIGFKSTDKDPATRTIKFQVFNIGGVNSAEAIRQIQIGP